MGRILLCFGGFWVEHCILSCVACSFQSQSSFVGEVMFQIKGNGLWLFYRKGSLRSLIDVDLRVFFALTEGKGVSQTCCSRS